MAQYRVTLTDEDGTVLDNAVIVGPFHPSEIKALESLDLNPFTIPDEDRP